MVCGTAGGQLCNRDPTDRRAQRSRISTTVRPGSLLKEADLDAERKAIEEKLGRDVSDFEFASYLMYPKVFTDYALAADTYGPVSVIPTPQYFYGLPAGEELFLDLEKGKTLVIVNQALGHTDDKGMVTVFFELNGQPRRRQWRRAAQPRGPAVALWTACASALSMSSRRRAPGNHAMFRLGKPGHGRVRNCPGWMTTTSWPPIWSCRTSSASVVATEFTWGCQASVTIRIFMLVSLGTNGCRGLWTPVHEFQAAVHVLDQG